MWDFLKDIVRFFSGKDDAFSEKDNKVDSVCVEQQKKDDLAQVKADAQQYLKDQNAWFGVPHIAGGKSLGRRRVQAQPTDFSQQKTSTSTPDESGLSVVSIYGDAHVVGPAFVAAAIVIGSEVVSPSTPETNRYDSTSSSSDCTL